MAGRPPHLTIARTADRFGVSRNTIGRWIEEGRLDRIRITRKRFGVTLESIAREESEIERLDRMDWERPCVSAQR